MDGKRSCETSIFAGVLSLQVAEGVHPIGRPIAQPQWLPFLDELHRLTEPQRGQLVFHLIRRLHGEMTGKAGTGCESESRLTSHIWNLYTKINMPGLVCAGGMGA